MTDLETILSWFQTGDMPTEEEFRQTFSSLRHKNEKIPIAEVDGLLESLNNKVNVDNNSSLHFEDGGATSDIFLQKNNIYFQVDNQLEPDKSASVELKGDGGLVGGQDFSLRYEPFSFVQKKYVDDALANGGGGNEGGVWIFPTSD